MTTETLEVEQATAEQATAEQAMEATAEVKPSDAMIADAAMVADLERVAVIGERERGLTTEGRLEVGGIAYARMQANIDAFANSEDDAPLIRSQSAKLFAMRFGKASGTATDDKEVYRMVRAHAMLGMLPDAMHKDVHKLSWSALRVIVRWIDWNQKEDTFALRFTVDIGIKDDAGRTTRDIDATDMLRELIPALAVCPQSKGEVAKLLDGREEQARQAQLTFLNDRQRKQATAAKSMADRVKANEDRAALFDGFARRVVNAKLGADDVVDELFRRGLIPQANTDLDPTMLSNISADEASIIGKLLVQANNADAIGALFAALKPIVDASEATQPSKGATLHLDALGSTRTLKTA